jgi:hypothetical protein
LYKRRRKFLAWEKLAVGKILSHDNRLFTKGAKGAEYKLIKQIIKNIQKDQEKAANNKQKKCHVSKLSYFHKLL